MWRAVLWLLLTPGELFLWLPFTLGNAEDVLYEDSEDVGRSDDDLVDFYETENTGDAMSTIATTDTKFHSRVRRFEDQPIAPSRSQYDIQEVKGALKEIMANREIETLTTAEVVEHKNFDATLTPTSTSDKEQFQDMLHDSMIRRNLTESFTYDPIPDNEVYRPNYDNSNENNESNEEVNDINRRTLADDENNTQNYILANDENNTQNYMIANIRPLKELNEFKDILSTQYMKRPNRTLPHIKYFKPITVNESANSQLEYYETTSAKTENEYITAVGLVDENPTYYTDLATRKTEFQLSNDSDYNAVNTVQLVTTAARNIPHRTSVNSARKYNDLRDINIAQMLTIASDVNATTKRDLDIPALLDIIANLTFDYGDNLTRRFNETLQNFQIPTCENITTSETILPTEPQFNIENATVIAKCFVCGLTTPEIPRDAYCADAFAGDFLPLVPVDPRARGQIARYRKYCRYMDVSGVMEFPEEPRSMFGRFTGGCSVRWIDLSGVYTQRACRNRRRAHTGKHFLSKRMAKLEMALTHVDNGCIVSPMATLVPLSRGISLYARFHACVCTGSWCNRAVLYRTWIVHIMLTAISTLEAISA